MLWKAWSAHIRRFLVGTSVLVSFASVAGGESDSLGEQAGMWSLPQASLQRGAVAIDPNHSGASVVSTVVDTCDIQFPGDANSNGSIEVQDIAYIQAFIDQNGPPPVPLANGDPNGDCVINGDDVAYLQEYLFGTGLPPVNCTCMLPGFGVSLVHTIQQVYDSLETFGDGRTFIVSGWYTDSADAKFVADYAAYLRNQVLPSKSVLLLDGLIPPPNLWGAALELAGFVDSVRTDPHACTADDTLIVYMFVVGYRLVGEGSGGPLEGYHQRPRKLEEAAKSGAQADTCKFAILLSGGVNSRNNHQRYWNMLEDYFVLLVNDGYPQDNIKVLYFDGVSDNQVVVPQACVRSADTVLIEEAVAEITGTMTQFCTADAVTIFIWVFNHGMENGNICLLDSAVLTPGTFADHVQDLVDAGCDNLYITMGQCFGGSPALRLKDIDIGGRTRMYVTADAHPDVPSWSRGDGDPYLESILNQLDSGKTFEAVMAAACSTYYDYLLDLDSKGRDVTEELQKRSIAWKRDRFHAPGDVAGVAGFHGGEFECLFDQGGTNCGNTVLYEQVPNDWMLAATWNWNIPGSSGYHSGNEFRRLTIDSSSSAVFKAVSNSRDYTLTASSIADTALTWKILPSRNDDDYAGFIIGWNDDAASEFGVIDLDHHSAPDINQIGFRLSETPRQFGRLGGIGVGTLDATFLIPEYNRYWSDVEVILDVMQVLLPGNLDFTYAGSSGSDMSIFIDTAGLYRFSLIIDSTRTSHTITFDAIATGFLVDFWGVVSLVPTGQTYVCGDVNRDGNVNVGDAVYLINFVFKGGSAPNPLCTGDANGDKNTNVGDAVYLINFVFKGGRPPVETCCP
jgi:hypothetical protein